MIGVVIMIGSFYRKIVKRYFSYFCFSLNTVAVTLSLLIPLVTLAAKASGQSVYICAHTVTKYPRARLFPFIFLFFVMG